MITEHINARGEVANVPVSFSFNRENHPVSNDANSSNIMELSMSLRKKLDDLKSIKQNLLKLKQPF